ncbi:uncharacterized protein LOC122259934 [Penaeus japonicus]|uniref:uncharacterized protein LOC122259934 n=1 Tax=Penaeus japonicus TaxID=27405 RepID=UPI001C70D4E1|nr:uncharacterized protein LOC122259934 [Penaeus japonicus]
MREISNIWLEFPQISFGVAWFKVPWASLESLSDEGQEGHTAQESIFDLADGGEAWQYAIDDDVVESHFVSASSTSLPWWMLDLGEQRLVYSVDILPMNYGHDAVHDIEIRVGAQHTTDEPPTGENFTAWALLGEYRRRYDPSEGRLVFSSDAGICGRYVAVQKVVTTADLLRLLDVKVYVADP